MEGCFIMVRRQKSPDAGWQTAKHPQCLGAPCRETPLLCKRKSVAPKGKLEIYTVKSRGRSNTEGLFYFNVFTVVGLRLLYTK